MTDSSDCTESGDPPNGSAVVQPIIAVSGEQGAGSPWVGIAANRGSGVGRGRRLVDLLVYELRRLGLSADVAWTSEARAALVRRASLDRNCRCVVAVGGDGTVSALLNERPGPPMTVMPAGTENLVARHFGLRRDPHGLARAIAIGRTVPVDVAQAADRRFLLMAGFGFDADVVTRHHRGRISHTGNVRPTSRMAYVLPVLRASFSYRFPTISVRILDQGAEEILRGTTVFVFNLPRYALGLPFVPVARDDDGWLDLIVFRHPGPFRALFYLWKVFFGVHLNDPSVYHRRVRKVVVTSRAAIPVQLDGDPGGYVLPDPKAPHVDSADSTRGGITARLAEWNVEILPSGIRMLVPSRRGGDRLVRHPLVNDGHT
jgi:diacylglycerol kinase family enzyme